MRPFNLDMTDKLRNAVSDPNFRCFMNVHEESFEILIADEIDRRAVGVFHAEEGLLDAVSRPALLVEL